MEAEVYEAKWMEDSSAYVLARLKKKDSSHNRVIVAAADFSSITRTIILVSDGSTVHGPTTLTIADVILSALSTGSIWTKDTTGFNFIDPIPPAAFPNPVDYRARYKFTVSATEIYHLLIQGPTVQV